MSPSFPSTSSPIHQLTYHSILYTLKPQNSVLPYKANLPYCPWNLWEQDFRITEYFDLPQHNTKTSSSTMNGLRYWQNLKTYRFHNHTNADGSDNWPTCSSLLTKQWKFTSGVGDIVWYTLKFKRGESNKPVLTLFQMTAEGGKEEFWPLKRQRYLYNT